MVALHLEIFQTTSAKEHNQWMMTAVGNKGTEKSENIVQEERLKKPASKEKRELKSSVITGHGRILNHHQIFQQAGSCQLQGECGVQHGEEPADISSARAGEGCCGAFNHIAASRNTTY